MSGGPRNRAGARGGQESHRRQIQDGKDDRFSTGRAVQGQKGLSGQLVSSLSLEVFKQKLETPSHTPPWACWGNSCTGMRVGRLLGRNEDAAPAPRAIAHSFIHSAHVHLLLPGWGPRQNPRKTSSLSFPQPHPGGKTGAGRGQRMEALAAHAHVTDLYRPLSVSQHRPRAGQGQAQRNLLLHPAPSRGP